MTKEFDRWLSAYEIEFDLNLSVAEILRLQDTWDGALQSVVTYATDCTTSTTAPTLVKDRTDSLSHNELVDRAHCLFIENSWYDIANHTTQCLMLWVLQEESDRKHGCRPNYNLDDLAHDDFK